MDNKDRGEKHKRIRKGLYTNYTKQKVKCGDTRQGDTLRSDIRRGES